ncbi:hypothetical protein Taro_053641 [Colocasia esculenta]|uniref:Uncharacterized protein n=1 Tax=Colocasia esculenta TaxID=4460 RepID=A0A843XLJ2_COLES|nr:hypothetical protein [Colocasia esculenta]
MLRHSARLATDLSIGVCSRRTHSAGFAGQVGRSGTTSHVGQARLKGIHRLGRLSSFWREAPQRSPGLEPSYLPTLMEAAKASSSSSSSSSSLPVVRVVEQCRVSPSIDGQPAIGGEVSIPLTFWDVLWIGRHPVERLFFYRWPGLATPHFAASALPRLKRSLTLALRSYYPLAGRLRPPQPAPSPEDKFHILCTDADSIPFALAELCGDGDEYPSFDQLAADHPHGIDTLRPLVPEIPPATGGDGLTALQVTVFPGAGVCIGVSISHAACDGSGFTSFVKAWASTCRGLYSVFYDTMLRCKDVKWPAMEGPAVVQSTFLLRRVDIQELRRQVSEEGAPVAPYSSFVLSCAYVWVCLLKSAAEPPPPPPEVGDAAYLAFAVDCRSRLMPPLPSSYFGNCLGFCFVEARRRDLLSDQGGVGRAAEAVARSVGGLGKDGQVLQDAEEWIPKGLAWLPGRPLSVAGSPRFGVYGTDFGWGRPAKVEVLGIEKTGAISLAESKHGDGGIEVGVALRSGEMAKFSSLFAAGLKDTSNGDGRR